MPAITFDLAAFRVRYPEFAGVSDALLTAFFAEAGLYLNNDDAPIADVAVRSMLFNMLVAHLAALSGAVTADGQPRPVGRVSQASEGSVSASFEDVTATPGSGLWFRQTSYGAAFWRAVRPYRNFRYILPDG